MFSFIWHSFFFDPIYNALVFFIDIMPRGDVGLSIIATVILVKLLLFPLSIKAIKTQKIMRELEPKLKQIKEDNKDDKEAQGKAMLAAYKEAGMNPFASILVLFIQIPVVIALYMVVSKGSAGIVLPEINPDILYFFVPMPDTVSMLFLNMLDITTKSLALALVAGITYFISMKLSLKALPERDPNKEPEFKDDLMRNMHLQMKYVMPVIITVTAYTFSATIAIYFIVSNLMTILQEVIVRKHR